MFYVQYLDSPLHGARSCHGKAHQRRRQQEKPIRKEPGKKRKAAAKQKPQPSAGRVHRPKEPRTMENLLRSSKGFGIRVAASDFKEAFAAWKDTNPTIQ